MGRYLKQNKGLFTVCILLGAVASAASAGISLILQRIMDIAIAGNLTAFGHILIFTAVYMIVLCALGYISSLSGKALIRNMTRQIREVVFRGIMKQTPADFYQKNTADYISALTNDIKMIEENYLLSLLMTVEMGVMFFVTLVILLFLSPLVTAILLVSMVLIFIIPALLGKAMQKRQDRVSRQLSVFTQKVKDIFSGFEVIRSFYVLPHTKAIFDRENKRAAEMKFRADKLLALNEGLSDVLSTLSVVAVIFVSAWLVLKGQISVGTLLALTQLSGTFMAPVIMVMQNVPKIKGVAPIAERLNGMADYETQELAGTVKPSFQREIRMEHVTFAYKEGEPVLQDINLTFEKGKKYAVIGHSGSGKSTAIKLMTGYSGKYQGNILYDDQELRSLYLPELGQIVSMIHQNVYLFDSTIRENIAMWEEFSQQQWEYALHASGVSLFVNDLEHGLDTAAGENGANLSGGQRQRIAVARALIRNTPVLVLDEGTSAIDRKTAGEIEAGLLKQENLTVICITHHTDPENLERYDQIYRIGK